MFIDLNDFNSNEKLQFDICIIGAGAAGITLAKTLNDGNLQIALLESGGLNAEGDTQALYEGIYTGPEYMPLKAVRLRAFGGTTGYWGGQSIPLDEFDFTYRDWIPNSGWPISYSELMKYIPEASNICGVPLGGYQWSSIHDNNKPEFPFNPHNFNDLIMRFSSPPRHFGEYYRDEVGQSKNITCFLHANVTGIITNETASHISHVNVSTLDGKKTDIYAKKFVLACGGIENSRLLLLSNQVNPAGIGNEYDQVGRYFMEHPNFDSGLIKISDGVKVTSLTNPRLRQGAHRVRLDFRISEKEQKQLSILNHSAFFAPKDIPQIHMHSDIGFMDKVWNKLESLYEKAFESDSENINNTEFTLRIRLEQAPNKNSRITLNRDKDALGLQKAQLDLRFTDLEGKTIEAVQEKLARELGNTGIGRMRIDFDPTDSNWKNQCGWQVHHSGGTRMHKSPKHGVVDPNSKVFGTDNLWVAGSSIFPTSGHANPTMNFVALCLRLAEHLKTVKIV
jgi:choline dehydrogenase-like flavoprotein